MFCYALSFCTERGGGLRHTCIANGQTVYASGLVVLGRLITSW